MGLPRPLSVPAGNMEERQLEGPRRGKRVNKPETGGEFWRLAWLREKASLEVRAAAPTSAAGGGGPGNRLSRHLMARICP